MNKQTKILLSGFTISFVGSLPLGVVNSTVFQVAASKNVVAAIEFSVAIVAVELIIVLLALLFSRKLKFSTKLSLYILPLAITLMLYLAFSSFMSLKTNQEIIAGMTLFPKVTSMAFLGLLISLLNPMQVLFWLGWNSVLLERKTLKRTTSSYLSYTTGIGLGSAAGLAVFIVAGSLIFKNSIQYKSIIVFIMGVFYLGISFYLMFLFYKSHLKLKIQ